MSREPDYDDEQFPPPREDEGDAWEYWHQRAMGFEAALRHIATSSNWGAIALDSPGAETGILIVNEMQRIARAALAQ